MEEFVLIGEACRLAGVSEKTLRKWVDAGLVESPRVTATNLRAVNRADLLRFLRERAEARRA